MTHSGGSHSEKKIILNSECSKNYNTAFPLLIKRAGYGDQLLFLTKFHETGVH